MTMAGVNNAQMLFEMLLSIFPKILVKKANEMVSFPSEDALADFVYSSTEQTIICAIAMDEVFLCTECECEDA